MKKNYLFLFAIIVVAMFSFTSCESDHDDDDDTGSNIGTVNLYIDGGKINTNSISGEMLNSIQYDVPSMSFPIPNLSLTIAWGDRGESVFFYFDGINLNTLKVGDDLAKLCSRYDYQISYENNVYWLQSEISWYDEFADGKGEFIVKELNADKTVINIDFKDVKLPILKGSLLKPDRSKMIDIKGNMKYKIDF